MDRIIPISGVSIKVIENPDGTYSAQSVLDGTDVNNVLPLTGGSGSKGWLSSIYKTLTGLLSTKIQDSTGVNTLVVNTDGSIKTANIGSSINVCGLLNVATAGTRIPLPNIPCREVTIIARRLNTGYIYAGDSTTSAIDFGIEMASKESYTFAVANANQVYIDSSVSGEGISYVAI